jgi:hypothetical protein
MKPMQLALMSLSLLYISPSVLAQNYSGTVGDLNTIFDPPMNINGILCDVHVNTGTEHAYKACSDGVSAARWMAEKYAKNTGKYLGCLDGFYQGVHDGYQGGINPTQEMIRQAEAYVKGANFDSAAARGLERARAEGQTESADQIIRRYRSVVGLKDPRTGAPVLPDKSYNYPKVTFNGFEDGYEFDILRQGSSEFDAVYQTGWVSRNSSFEDRLAARRALALQREYATSLCNQNETIFGRRGMPVVTLWDFFRANRQYNFQTYGWRNPDWAWEIFDKDERTLEQYQTFTRLRNLEKTITETIPVKESRLKLDNDGNPIRRTDANGQPVVDAQGRPVFVMEEIITGYRTETRRVKLSDAEVQALANIYINGFKQAYDRYYARQYASQNYHSEGIEKYKIARIIGKTMGEDVANHVARKNAYNTQYQLQSAKKYAEEVKRLYKVSFDRLIGIFENNPVIELNDAQVIGQVQDGIFRPGEELKVQFGVTNLGEVSRASSINFESTSDVQASSAGFSFTAPVLDRSNYVTNILGRINPNKEARQSITIAMGIKNPGDLAEVAKPLVVRKQTAMTLNDYAEIDAVRGSLDYIQGRLELLVDVKNPATVDSPSVSTIEASMGTLGAVDRNIEPIGARSVRQVALTIENMDPLALIISGSASGNVNVRLASKTVHRQGVSFNIGADRQTALIRYLDALATKRSKQTGRETKVDRLVKLQTMIEELVRADIARNVLWKKPSEVEGTAIGLIQRVYDESKRAGRIDDQAQQIYNDLGRILARNVHLVKAGGGLRIIKKGNKQNYLDEITEFAKISKNLKDY